MSTERKGVSYTKGELVALIAPILDRDPRELWGLIVIGVCPDGGMPTLVTVDNVPLVIKTLGEVITELAHGLIHDEPA